MIKHFKYVTGVFVIALMIGAIGSTPAKAGNVQLPPNHEALANVCVCIATGAALFNRNVATPDNRGRCPRGYVRRCFVDTQLMPVFWKDQIICEEIRFVPFFVDFEGSPAENFDCNCPCGKMVISCDGFVSFAPGVDSDDFPGPPAPKVDVAVWAKADGTGCRLRARNQGDGLEMTHLLNAFCVAPFPDDPRRCR